MNDISTIIKKKKGKRKKRINITSAFFKYKCNI